MADFSTFDLSRVIQGAEAIKGMRREAETDVLRQNYLKSQIAGQEQAQQHNAQLATHQKKQWDRADLESNLPILARAMQQVAASDDPHTTAQQVFPELIQAGIVPPDRLEATLATDPQVLKQNAQQYLAKIQPFLQPEPAKEGYTLSEGQTRFDSKGKPIASVAAKPKEMTPYERERLELERERLRGGNEASKPPAGYRDDGNGNLTFIPGGPADPSRKNDVLRPIPAAVAQGIVENRNQVAKIDRALASLDENPDAFGLKNYTPDIIQQRLPGKGNSGGVDARAQVADIGSMVIHDRSGAAVSASEFPRLKPFIPAATDDPAVVKTKLKNLRANVAAIQEETESLYSQDTGYKPLPSAEKTSGASGSWEPGAAKQVGGFTVRRVK